MIRKIYHHFRRPFDYSIVTDYLVMGTTPRRSDYKMLKKLNVKLIVNMRAEKLYNRMPIKTIWIPSLDNKSFPIKPQALFSAITKCNEVIDKGGKVFVFCRAGRHRSLVMSAAILISRGYNQNQAIDLIIKARPVADPEAKHIYQAVQNYAIWQNKISRTKFSSTENTLH